MPNILDYLNTISEAVYGKDVRQAIVDAISTCYEDGRAGVNDLEARRLIESAIGVNESQQADIDTLYAQVAELQEGGGESEQQSTTITLDTVISDGGFVDSVSVANNSVSTYDVTFTQTFTEIPQVFACVAVQNSASSAYSKVTVGVVKTQITTTGFRFFIANSSGASRSTTVVWAAFQPTTKEIDLDITIPSGDGMSEADVLAITNPIQTSLNGIKTGYDGTVYSTPGEAVREQINDLHVLIGDEPGTAISGTSVGYDGTDSGLSATDMQSAVDEVADALSSTNERLDGIADVSVVNGQLVIDGVSYDLGGNGIASITKTGTSGLVDTYTILFTDGTSTTFTVTNGDASDAKIQGFIEDWLEEHPEATTTVQDGAITLAKLAPDVSAKLTDTDLSYKWVANGYMREHVRPFQGWAQNVVYDPDLGKAVGIINSGAASHTNEQPWYRVTIDKTGYMSPYEEVAVYDTDGVTPYVPAKGYMGTVQRLSDGTYLCVDGSQNIYKSTDHLATLTLLRTGSFTAISDGSMFSLTELSNSRLIMGHGGQVNGFWYSDDDGVTWTNVIPDASGLGQQIYPESGYKPFEPCFIEIGDGKVLAIARKSMTAYGSGYSTLAEAQYAVKESAVISKSSDYGATWSAWVDSETITDMTACNGKATIIDGKAHFVFGSRWKNSNGNNFQLFYTYASLDDAYADDWAEPVAIDVCQWDVNTATNSHDSGYPSVWADENANLYSVHYDGDGTGSAFGANWRLCTGSPVAKLPALNAGGSGSLNVGYTQKAVDSKMNAIWAKINEILLLLGQTPEDSGEYDGTSPIYNGLVAWFDVTQESKWNGAVITSMVGELTATAKDSTSSGVISPSSKAPTAFNNGFADIGLLYFNVPISSIVGASVTAFTVEYAIYITGNNTVFYTKTTSQTNASNANNPNVYTGKGGNALFDRVFTVPYHVCSVFESGKVTWYVNGVKKTEETTAVTFADILASYPLPNAHNSSSGACLGDVRFYNRALTADEIHNNYLYTQSETNYLVAPTFS